MKILFQIISYIFFGLSFLFSSLMNIISPNPAVTEIRVNLAMDIKPSQVEFHEDTHGWFGDGEEIIIFNPDSAQVYKIYHQWQKTPVDDAIATLIFPKTEYNGLELAEYIPEKEGWWFFKNRGNFTNGYSFNFSFAFFDGEKVYYYELDT